MKTHLFSFLFFFGLICSGKSHAQTIVHAPDFTIGSGFNGVPQYVVKQPDNKLLVCGQFSAYNGFSAQGICRLLPDGTFDTTFQTPNPDIGGAYAMALQPDGKVIVVGRVSPFDDGVNGGIIRLNTDGTTDTSFHTGTGISPQTGSATVMAVTVQPNGKIIASGYFTSYNGSPAHDILRINPDGSLDNTFSDPGQYLDYMNSNGEYVSILTVIVQPDGKVIAGGVFDEFNNVPHTGLLRFNTDGTLDNTFTTALSLDTSYGAGNLPFVQTMKQLNNGKIVIGGNFSSVDDHQTFCVARLLTDGSVDTAFRTANDDLLSSVAAIGQVYNLDVQPDEKVVIGGQFNNYDGTTRYNLLRLMQNGSTDFGFNLDQMETVQGNWTSVMHICSLSDTTLAIVGDFTSVQNENRMHIAKLDVCGSFSTTDVLNCEAYTWPVNNETYQESGTYFATTQNANGCDSILRLHLTIPSQPNIAELCIVGVDSLTNENRVVWEKPISAAIDSFYIYRETNVANVYQSIGATGYNEPGVFIDANSDPTVQAYRYKISVIDSCGRETALSSIPHKTIHLTINQGIGNTWNLIWTPYEGISVPTYEIYRGSNSGNMTLLTAVSGNMTSYSDQNAPDSVYYQIGFVNPNDCDPAKSIDYSKSRSNISSNNPLELGQTSQLYFQLSPNPAEDYLYVQLPVTSGTISIRSSVGAIVATYPIDQSVKVIPTGNLASGIYTFTIETTNGIATQRFVKR